MSRPLINFFTFREMYAATSFGRTPWSIFSSLKGSRSDSKSQALSSEGTLKRSENIFGNELSTQGPPPQIHYPRLYDVVQRQLRSNSEAAKDDRRKSEFHPMYLEEAYQQCRRICEQGSKTYYLGTLIMSKERQRAIWAIYAWGRRIDDVVDDEAATSADLDRWEARLEDIFAGRPHDMIDAALVDTISNFSLDIMLFKDLMQGMRMDLSKNRYSNFQELYLYCYYVAGTFALMLLSILGIATDSTLPLEKICSSAIHIAVANQLTNILRDVGEDAARGRVYLPQDELQQFGLSDQDIFSRKVTDRWREFTKEQIKRAKLYFDQTEEIAFQLEKTTRWPVLSSLMICRMILDEIEHNDYDNLTKRAHVGHAKKILMALPLAYIRAHY